MCGIAGVAGRADTRGEEVVRCMMERLRHRGPDGGGLFVDAPAGVALGHRRLAILDLTDAGRQPMTSRDGRWTIALNGEIFNYLELRSELGGAFRTGTDTEVLLEACAAWGVEKALERSIGMFALAIWDSRDRELTLARDRVGERPLVYWRSGAALAFSSELKALRGLSDRRMDPEAVEAYLALGYIPAPLTVFRDCRKLSPGHLLRWKNGSIETRRWWFPERATAGRLKHDTAELREMMADSVRLRLRADVPIALFLSGGVDSSVIAAECVRQGQPISAFTVGMGDETDLPYARRVASALGLQHEVLRLGERTLPEEVEKLLRHYDEPFADSSAIPSLALATALAGRYKVVLNGDGGDEAFGGYRHYQHIRVKQALKTVAAGLGLCDGGYIQSKAMFRATERVSLLNGNARPAALGELLAKDPFLENTKASGALGRAMWSDRHLYLPNDLTYKMDVALASAGIEGRAPFLDHRLLEWAQSLGRRKLVRGSKKKVLLRKAYRGILPDGVLDRPKQGFGAPVRQWLRGPLRNLAEDLLPCPLLDRAAQKSLSGQRLWTLVMLSAWARQWRATW